MALRWLGCCLLLGLMVGTGCRRPTADEVVQESLRLAKAGDSPSMLAAAKKLKPLAESKQANASITELYLICLWQSGQTTAALTLANEAAKRYPESAMCNYLVGKLATVTNHSDQALPALRTAYRLNPKDLNTLTLLAYVAGRENDPRGTVYFALLEQSDKSLANRAEMYNEWALWHAQRGGYAPSLSILTKAMGLPNPSPTLYLNAAVIFERQNIPRVARRYYEKYLAEAKDKFPEVARQVKNRLNQLPQEPAAAPSAPTAPPAPSAPGVVPARAAGR